MGNQTNETTVKGDSMVNGAPGNSETVKTAEKKAMAFLEGSYEALTELAAVRAGNKLSCSRVNGLAKEVRELIKVMSLYECR